MADATLQMNRAGKLETPETYLKAKCSNNGHTSLSVKQLRVFFFFSFGTCLALFVVMICHPQAAGATGVEAEAEAEASMWGTNAEINNV